MTELATRLEPSRRPLAGLYSGNVRAVVVRGLMALKTNNWAVFISGFVEPVLYLAAMGIGLGPLIGSVEGPGGEELAYSAYIAPALLAVSAMNGAVYDSTNNVFFKLRFSKLYQNMLYTSLGPLDVAIGEIYLALQRGFLYATGFMIIMSTMGLVTTPAALLMIPASVLIAFGFAALGMGITSFMKRFQHLDWINFALLPMFLFSATLYPLSVYPGGIQLFIQALPLWHGVELLRSLSVAHFTTDMLWHVAYYVVMIVVGVVLTTSRLRTLFLK
ncbi:ABC transporter permease [Zhihengliuella salsuginis]|uniref:Transport permease protein n=1 Tax=Zhihengliuella salsuginis TaxID=578222 RepID=A0ABQ3GKN7_9MICC|nr:ABC transporter permease [Zhihengliuella salsuginis]GHD09380.1 transport permease protein [Zhihengliuella salsuginis]